ncbi:MAG: hypothetical protein IJW50_03815 [Clostridia bacterium]|nr:hypothetical protein [Clostridia bacterium]
MNNLEKQNLYTEANAFYELAECGRKNIPERKSIETYIPYIVNMTFAIELFLKLLLEDNGKTIGELKDIGHNLYSLYNALEDTQKKEIYQKFKRPLIYNIPEEINNIASAFPDWRYLVLNKANNNSKEQCVKLCFIKELAEVLNELCQTVLKNG